MECILVVVVGQSMERDFPATQNLHSSKGAIPCMMGRCPSGHLYRCILSLPLPLPNGAFYPPPRPFLLLILAPRCYRFKSIRPLLRSLPSNRCGLLPGNFAQRPMPPQARTTAPCRSVSSQHHVPARPPSTASLPSGVRCPTSRPRKIALQQLPRTAARATTSPGGDDAGPDSVSAGGTDASIVVMEQVPADATGAGAAGAYVSSEEGIWCGAPACLTFTRCPFHVQRLSVTTRGGAQPADMTGIWPGCA